MAATRQGNIGTIVSLANSVAAPKRKFGQGNPGEFGLFSSPQPEQSRKEVIQMKVVELCGSGHCSVIKL
ncbi:MAG: hypothetical protein U1B77_00930, partial [Dehalococcoidales bacterium]|nr:hypothetical protein [Dehalococcoidales bacterium]